MFATMEDARAAGYVPARGWSHDYRGVRLVARDASGPSASGERYTLVATSLGDPTWTLESETSFLHPGFEGSPLSAQTFGHSEAVKIGDAMNNMRQSGAYVVMFDGTTIAAAVDVFHAQVDQFYAANPDAVEWEARRDEIDNRPGERIARFGEALYGPRWQSDLARDLGVADRTVRAWVAGERRPAVGVWADLARIMHERRERLSALLDDLS